ncbi:MAG: EAL domain-containing response regulator [Burkholderiales bacterium]|nr:EAL domain-containing response regulator [Burkholderiales bacterium]
MDLSKLRFLVAEEQPYQRRCIVRMLYGMGAKSVTEAADSAGTMEVFRSHAHRFDVIVCDLDMPGVGGLEFFSGIERFKDSAAVIFTSGLDPILLESVGARARAQGLVVLGAIQKPLTAQKLVNALEHARGAADTAPASMLQSSAGMRQMVAVMKGGQLEPWYQPKVSLASGRLTGAETLARWRHPSLGLLDPAGFMPAIETYGLIGALTWCLLEQSARACRAWRDAGLPASVSVKLAPVVLRESDLADRLARRVEFWGLAPQLLVLEVDEAAVMSQRAIVLENLTELRMCGFGLSLDDYGRGFCPGQQISRIPFTELKIDRSLVGGVDLQPQREGMVADLVDAANRFGISTVAEGVETHGEWELLARLGCDSAQGHYVAPPMDLASFRRWAAQSNGAALRAA